MVNTNVLGAMNRPIYVDAPQLTDLVPLDHVSRTFFDRLSIEPKFTSPGGAYSGLLDKLDTNCRNMFVDAYAKLLDEWDGTIAGVREELRCALNSHINKYGGDYMLTNPETTQNDLLTWIKSVYNHPLDVGCLAGIMLLSSYQNGFVQKFGVDETRLRELLEITLEAGIRHDMGKIHDDKILELVLTPRKLVSSERKTIEQHVQHSIAMAKEAGCSSDILYLIGSHHEILPEATTALLKQDPMRAKLAYDYLSQPQKFSLDYFLYVERDNPLYGHLIKGGDPILKSLKGYPRSVPDRRELANYMPRDLRPEELPLDDIRSSDVRRTSPAKDVKLASLMLRAADTYDASTRVRSYNPEPRPSYFGLGVARDNLLVLRGYQRELQTPERFALARLRALTNPSRELISA